MTRPMRSLFGAATLLAAVVLASAVLRLEAGRAAPPEDVASLIRRLDPSIAHVTVRIQGDRPDASRDDGVGAGFVYRSDGQIVTSRHVLQGALEVFVTLPGHGTMPARVLGQDPVTDVALLQVAATGLVPLGIGDPRTLAKGDPVLVAGSPFHLERSWSAGIVSGLHRSQIGVNPRGYEDYIQTDAATNLGNSGGPMVDRGGRVVGVMTAILSRTGRSQGVALATPIDAVVAALARIQRGAGPQRPTLGLVVRERDTRGTLRPGLTISRFEPRSPVRDAGVLPGDILLAIDGTPTARTADLQRIVWSHQAGEIVALTLERNGRRYDVRVRLR